MNFKFNNTHLIFILLLIILANFIFSSINNNKIYEGLTIDNDGTTPECNDPPYGDNSDGFWYNGSCFSYTNNYYAIVNKYHVQTDISSIDCRDISDVSFNDLFNNSQFNAYYVDDNNTIKLLNINNSISNPTTIIFNCSNTPVNKINDIILYGYPQELTFLKGNITNELAGEVKILKYPDDFQNNNSSTVQNNAQQITQNLTQSTNDVNVNVNESYPAAKLINPNNNPYNNLNTVNTVPAIAFPASINSVLMPTQPNFIHNDSQRSNTLYGNGGSNGSLHMNNISDQSTDNNTPSTIFTTHDGRQGIANTDNTINGITSSKIPEGQQDLYVLKSQIVPPVCPACPPVIVDKNTLNQECPPCPPCARCPEPSFDCKKVPNYNLGPENKFLPRPVLNSFSTFGM